MNLDIKSHNSWKVKLSFGTEIKNNNFGSNLRRQLWVIDQVLQWVAAAEFIQQAGQVADYSWRVRGVDKAWDVPNLYQRHVPIGIGPIGCAHLQRETPPPVTLPPPRSINNTRKVAYVLWYLCFLYHQAVATGLQSAEADAEQDRRGEGVVVHEATALGVTVVTVQSQVCVRVAREKHRAEVDL